MPRYTYGEAGRYLGLPLSTVRAWFAGMPYGRKPDVRYYHPILTPASSDLLSFYDIASAHVLMAMKARGVSPDDLRFIIEGLTKEYPDSQYPLLGRNFFVFGREVVIKKLGERLNLSRGRQLGMKAVMDKFLARIEFDANLMPIRFSPLRSQKQQGKGFIIIDPDLAAGRPVIRGTGIAAEIIAKRKKSGESESLLAKDYRISRLAVKEAVKYFPAGKAA
ncbi:MAG TPA: DUF433 domain-containing protein [Candidatus Saccharimonadales bacterium]|nr:DUF433 domain-containing protein [Candidatus Saccharimonadales bacterium]